MALLLHLKIQCFLLTITENPLRNVKLELLVFRLASLDPLFEQVFVVAVRPGTKREDSFVRELAAVGVDEHGHQAVLFAWQLVDQPHYLIHSLLGRLEKNRTATINV